MDSRLAALLLLISFGLASAQMLQDCCLRTSDKRVPRQIAKSYRIQEAGKGCSIAATIFISHSDRTMCSPPAQDSQWVSDLIAHLDNKRKNKHSSS